MGISYIHLPTGVVTDLRVHRCMQYSACICVSSAIFVNIRAERTAAPHCGCKGSFQHVILS